MSYQGKILLIFSIFLFFGCSRYGGYYHPSYHKGINRSKAMYKATMRPYEVSGIRYYPNKVKIGTTYKGIASWYGDNFHGNTTSNGEMFNMFSYTAAHKTLPMNTMVKVTNLLNNKSVIVRINDRGPFVPNRIIDLSYAAAKKIGMIATGTAPVKITVVGFDGKIYKQDFHTKPPYKTQTINYKTTKYKIAKISYSQDLAVQIGAFTDLKSAHSYRKRYDHYMNKYRTLVVRTYKNGKELYKVLLKGFTNEEEAREFIKSHKIPNAFLVKN